MRVRNGNIVNSPFLTRKCTPTKVISKLESQHVPSWLWYFTNLQVSTYLKITVIILIIPSWLCWEAVGTKEPKPLTTSTCWASYTTLTGQRLLFASESRIRLVLCYSLLALLKVERMESERRDDDVARGTLQTLTPKRHYSVSLIKYVVSWAHLGKYPKR
jgi:hypothetical protein